MDRRIAVGQHFFTGFAGPKMTESFIRDVREHKIGNVILFEYNVESKEQLALLCRQIRELILAETGQVPFIAIDQEGGTVTRLKEDATIFPCAMAIAATGDTQNAYEAGYVTGLELRAMGVNMNLAPVMDVNSDPRNPVIGVRSYGDDPSTVSRFGVAMAQGLVDGGVLSCAKHFPGHGDTAVDSHIGLPLIEKSIEAMEICELVPFQAAIKAGVSAIMTAHILFPALEPDRLPATLSRRIITGLLRQKLGFQGLILSDCMMMYAISEDYGTIEGSVVAIQAGVDMVFISHDVSLAAQAVIATHTALMEGHLDESFFDASTARILASKATLSKDVPPLNTVGSDAHRQKSLHATYASLTMVNDTPFTLGNNPLFLGCTRFRPTLAANPEDETQRFPIAMQSLLGGDARITPPNPTTEDIKAALIDSHEHSAIVIGLYKALHYKAQLKMVRAAAATGMPVCAVALRNPFDLMELPPNVRAYAIYDYDARTMAAFADVLSGKHVCTGKLPLRRFQT